MHGSAPHRCTDTRNCSERKQVVQLASSSSGVVIVRKPTLCISPPIAQCEVAPLGRLCRMMMHSLQCHKTPIAPPPLPSQRGGNISSVIKAGSVPSTITYIFTSQWKAEPVVYFGFAVPLNKAAPARMPTPKSNICTGPVTRLYSVCARVCVRATFFYSHLDINNSSGCIRLRAAGFRGFGCVS